MHTHHRRVLLVLFFFCACTITPAQQEAKASLAINAGKVENTISPILYGQFAEFMFEDIKGGLYAELIRDRGFNEAPNALGLSRYWERDPDDRDDDDALHFTWDDSVYTPVRSDANTLSSQHSLRVDIDRNDGRRRGIRQGWIPIRKGLEYKGYVWVKAADYSGTITIALEADQTDGERYASATLSSVNGDWKQYRFTLVPEKSDSLAKIAILFSGHGRIWIDQVSLLPGDAEGGVRRDVAEKALALHPAFIRWPGGNVAQDYHWQWGVGPRDARPTWINLAWRNELESGDFGTNEFIRFARNAGAEPSITVNVEGHAATADEAAAWVEYCNGPPSSTYGSLRARDGHPEPYRVKYWEIGNEIWGDWVRGHSDASTYARNLGRYVAAMRAVDPSIEVIAVGDNDMAWNRAVIQRAGVPFDYLAIHHYYGRRDMQGDLAKLVARPLHYEQFYGEVEALFAQLPADRRPKLAINEWGLDLPESQQYSIVAALYAARLMNVFERHGDLVAMSAVSDMVNGWPGGIIQASRQGVFVTPIYLVNQLYAEHRGDLLLATTVNSPTFNTSREGTNIPYLDATASLTADGKTIFIKAVNTS